MMKLRTLMLLATAAGPGILGCSRAAPPAPGSRVPDPATPVGAAHDAQAAAMRRIELAREIAARIEAGTADPAADAAAAAGRGDFGLMASIMNRGGSLRAPGLACFTPYRRPPRIRALYGHGDVIDARVRSWSEYAAAYNQALASRPDYPDADICRPSSGRETGGERDEQAATTPARDVAGPPRSLHEAGRRGGAADVRRLLADTPVNARDGLEMTALAWAVARDNRPAAEALIHAGADPWAGGPREGGAVYLAAALGRGGWFLGLSMRGARPFPRWQRAQLVAAVGGGNPLILAQMLREPHEPVQAEMLRTPLPAATLVEMLLRDNPLIATALLRRAADRESRPDLVRLALAYHADPNAPPPQGGMESPLGSAASTNSAQSLEIVDQLLRAGADPNGMSWRKRPLWIAVQTMRIGQREPGPLDPTALAIFRRLRAGGADINLPDFQGRPPVWALLFPQSYAHRQLDAYYLTPVLLELLAESGLDLNAQWEGDRVLTEVERQAGRASELAVTLRRLGARR